MFVLRSTYRALQDRYQQVIGQRNKAVETAAERLATITRISGRNTELTDRLTTARSAVGVDTEYAHRLESRLERALRACARYRAELADEQAAHAKTRDNFEIFVEVADEVPLDMCEERRLRRLAERAHRSLDEQLRPLQAANEAMAAELRDLRESGASA